MIRRKDGFTLAEILIASALIILVAAAALETFIFLIKSYKVLTVYLDFYLKGREMIDFISKDCRMAVRVTDEYAGYTTADDCLALKVPSLDEAGNIIDVNKEFDYIIYRMEDSDLWKKVIPGSASSRQAFDGVFKKSMGTLYIAHEETPLSNIEHKSSITSLTLRAYIVETIEGKEYKITPGTTVKLMNYEWEFVR